MFPKVWSWDRYFCVCIYAVCVSRLWADETVIFLKGKDHSYLIFGKTNDTFMESGFFFYIWTEEPRVIARQESRF